MAPSPDLSSTERTGVPARDSREHSLVSAAVADHFGGLDSSAPVVTVRRDRGPRGRVLEYDYPGGPRVFAKWYPTAQQARRAVDVLTALRSAGFDATSATRVPHPLAHLPGHGLVVLEAATGMALSDIAQGPAPAWESGLRGAAYWLARLHAAPTRVCERPDTVDAPLTRLRRRAEALLDSQPDLRPEVTRLFTVLQRRRVRDDTAGARIPAVSTHGRFHTEHVFVAPQALTVVDLDRAAPGDPARDVGEFLHRTRALLVRQAPARTAQRRTATADRATRIFLGEYRRRSGQDLPNLAYKWSFAVLWNLLGSMAKGRSTARLDFYRAEFAGIPQRLAILE